MGPPAALGVDGCQILLYMLALLQLSFDCSQRPGRVILFAKRAATAATTAAAAGSAAAAAGITTAVAATVGVVVTTTSGHDALLHAAAAATLQDASQGKQLRRSGRVGCIAPIHVLPHPSPGLQLLLDRLDLLAKAMDFVQFVHLDTGHPAVGEAAFVRPVAHPPG
eukprot:COSAG01_NODE_10470_length_2158_cov_3.148616_3_plen_166_part_00